MLGEENRCENLNPLSAFYARERKHVVHDIEHEEDIRVHVFCVKVHGAPKPEDRDSRF